MNDILVKWEKEMAWPLSALLTRLRGDWQQAGVIAALGQPVLLGRPAGRVAIAAVRAAVDPGVRTPAVIAMDGQHWQAPTSATALLPLPRYGGEPPIGLDPDNTSRYLAWLRAGRKDLS